MKRCKCGSTSFLVDYPEYNTYRTNGNFDAWELVKAGVDPAGDPDGSVECEQCGVVYEFEGDIPDAPTKENDAD